MLQKFNFISQRYEEVSKKYNSLVNDLEVVKLENEKIKEKNNNNEKQIQLLKNQNQQFINENNMIKLNENNMKKIIEETENKVNQTMQYNGKITNQIRDRKLRNCNILILKIYLRIIIIIFFISRR